MSDPSEREIEVFNAALELPAAERAIYLDNACAGDAALRQRVEDLLAAGDQAGCFLDSAAISPPGPGGSTRPPAVPSEKPGDRIGRYKLLQQIGEGGCGVVYMAEQEEPVRRRVALKVIKLGMDTKSVIARFEAERQALALMDHPNIAKVLEAGATETGRPYFVMELVRGVKITDYCDENNLSTVARLELFVLVCQAIQHAHQKGIIHRDIKPSNILVADHDGVPVPKIIDFGIAKATTDQRLTDKTLFTAFEQFIGTPAYMSPEQAKLSGLDIDTRSDIYSLGVLLYELLTSQTPFDAKELLQAGLDEIRRTIREQEPARPSTKLSTMLGADLTVVAKHRRAEPPTLIHLVRGDLDWIVMKALEKDRARRYETANGLAADVQRYLKDDAIVARPPSQLYRFQKLVRRNKLVFAAGSTVVAALVLGVIGTSIGFVRSRASEREARENFNMARTALDDLLVVADQDLQDKPGMEPLRVKLWREAIDRYKRFLERPSADPAPPAELARLYVKSAFAAEYIGADHEKVAVPAYQSAFAIEEQLVREYPQDRKLRSNLGWTDLISAWYAPDGPVRSNSLAKAVTIFEALAGETPGDPLARADLAWALYNSSWSAGTQQRTLSDRALVMREQLVREFPKSAEFRRDLANSLRQLGDLFQDDLPDALAKLTRSIDLDAALEEDLKQHVDAIWFPARPSDTELLRPSLRSAKRDEAAGCMSAARVNGKLGKWTEARVLADRAVGIYRRLVEQNPTITMFTAELWAADEFCAMAADQSESAAGGQTRRVAAANFWRELAKESGQQQLRSTDYSVVVGHGQWGVADMLRQKGQYLQAEQVLHDTVELFEKAAQGYPNELFLRQEQAYSRRSHGDVLEQLGRAAEAESEYRAAIALYAGLKATVPTNSYYCEEEASTTWMLAEMLQRANRFDEAEAEYRQAITLHEKATADFPNETILVERTLNIKAHLAELLRRRGRLAESGVMEREARSTARAVARKYHESMAKYEKLASDPDHHQDSWSFANSCDAIGGVFVQNGQTQEAERAYLDAQVLWRKLAANSDSEDYRFHLAANSEALGDVLREVAPASESLASYQAAQAIWATLVSDFNQEDRRTHLGWTDDAIGQLLQEAGRFDEAAEAYRQAMAVWQKMVADFNKDDYRDDLAGTVVNLAVTLQTAGKRTEAEQFVREAAGHADAQTLNGLAWSQATNPDPRFRDGPSAVTFAESAVAATQRTNVSYLDTLAAAYAETGQFAKAVSILQEAIALSQIEDEKQGLASRLQLYESHSPYRDDGVLAVLANARLHEEKFAEAEGLARECLTLRGIQIPDDWRTFNARSMLGGSLLGQKRYADAEPLLLAGYEGMKQREANIPPRGKVRLNETLQRLAQLYDAMQRPEQAAEWRKKLDELEADKQ